VQWAAENNLDMWAYYVVKPAVVGQGDRLGANVCMVLGLPNAAIAAWVLAAAVRRTKCWLSRL
jgi:hypothetical protein